VQRAAAFWSLLVASTIAVGCFPHSDAPPPKTPGEELRTRASVDLNCPEANLQMVDLGNNARGMTGCGKRATYLYVCKRGGGLMDDCTWVQNSDAKPSGSSGGSERQL
jgi:hypothetical protein